MVRLTGNFLNFQYENYITGGADTSDPHLRTFPATTHKNQIITCSLNYFWEESLTLPSKTDFPPTPYFSQKIILHLTPMQPKTKQYN